MMRVPVTLKPVELAIAELAANLRHKESTFHERKQGHGYTGDSLAVHLLGAQGEVAFAKHIKAYYGCDVNSFKNADIGKDIQIRTTTYEGGHLIVRHDDNDDHIFILVTADLKKSIFTIHGWIRGRDAKQQPDWLTDKDQPDRPESWFVPQEALHEFRVEEQKKQFETPDLFTITKPRVISAEVPL